VPGAVFKKFIGAATGDIINHRNVACVSAEILLQPARVSHDACALCARPHGAFQAPLFRCQCSRYYACTFREHISPVPCANSKITQAIFFIRRHRRARVELLLHSEKCRACPGDLKPLKCFFAESECKTCTQN
jgi:hypothetical protein